jgi:NADH-quinone oxidoreductase subunit L
VIIGMHHDQDIRNMGGLWKHMKLTWITSLVGSLALIGTPLLSGFYSKDSIIEAVHFSHLPGAGFAYFAVVVGVFVTAFYSFRMFFLVFHGKERFHDKPFPPEDDHAHDAHAHDAHAHDDHAHDADHAHAHHGAHTPHESPWVVTLPLVLLAIPSLVVGGLTIDALLFSDFFKDAIVVDAARHPAMAKLGEMFHGALGMAGHALSTLPFWLALGGVVLAALFYLVMPSVPQAIARALAPLVRVLENKYYFDWFNENVLARGARLLGTGLWKGGDQAVIDGALINGSARTVGGLAATVRWVQSGHLYWYALVMIMGLVSFMTWQLWPYLSAVLAAR